MKEAVITYPLEPRDKESESDVMKRLLRDMESTGLIKLDKPPRQADTKKEAA
jgi:hypothetical protein